MLQVMVKVVSLMLVTVRTGLAAVSSSANNAVSWPLVVVAVKNFFTEPSITIPLIFFIAVKVSLPPALTAKKVES